MSEARATLLIVEDDVDVAEMLTAYFRTQGYDVLAVNWGEDALKIARNNHPDLIILDIRLPDLNGFEVASRLRANERTKDIPIIFLTDMRERTHLVHGLELGADDYITKPFDIQELRLRVRNSLLRTTQSSLTNPVTGLPEGALVDERLKECLTTRDWAILSVKVENLDAFREAYGFVASDDVLRAVSLMIHNAMRDLGSPSDFMGQLGPTEFALVTNKAALPTLTERIRTRLEQSLDYFYPLKDRSGEPEQGKRMSIRLISLLSDDGPFKELNQLKAGLMHRQA